MVLLIVMYRITREMYFSRDRKKIVIIDEAWDLLSGGATAEFIEAGYRRARKYKGAFMSATQGVDDYYRNPAAKAALDNSDWMFLLRQKPESIEMMDKLGQLTMDDAMKRLLLSLPHRARRLLRGLHPLAGRQRHRPADRRSVQPRCSSAAGPRTSTPSTPSARRAWTSPPPSTRSCANGARVNARAAALLVGVNALVSAALIALVHLWLVPERLPALAVLDVAELYRLKELQVAAVLVKPRRQRRRTRRRTASRRGLRHGGEHAAPGAAGRGAAASCWRVAP